MRISDWSSDVCSSDLLTSVRGQADSLMMGGTVTLKAGTLYLDDKGTGSDGGGLASTGGMTLNVGALDMDGLYSYITAASRGRGLAAKTGRASCRARVCKYV